MGSWKTMETNRAAIARHIAIDDSVEGMHLEWLLSRCVVKGRLGCRVGIFINFQAFGDRCRPGQGGSVQGLYTKI